MAKTLSELVTLTRQKANVEANQVVTDLEIVTFINEALKSLYDLVIGVDASYYMKSDDFTLTGSAAGSLHALPSDFYKMRGLVIFPDTERETPVFLRSFSERARSPWGYTLDGDYIRVWPWQNAGQGPWRLYYVPKAPQFTASLTVRLATTASLSASGGGPAGIGHTLTEIGNGALVVDGVAAAVGDRVLVKDQGAAGFPQSNGIYAVTQTGSAGAPYILTRATDFDQAAEIVIGTAVYVTAGAVNEAAIWKVASFGGVVDTDGIVFTALGLDVTLDNFDEYITNKAALAVFAKRQMSPGLVPSLLNAAEARVRDMVSMRASEPEQAPIMWAPGRRRRSWYDDDVV